MTYVYYDQDLKDISNMPQITSHLHIPHQKRLTMPITQKNV